MSAFFADMDNNGRPVEEELSPGSLTRTASIPANAEVTMLDFGDPTRRGMPANSAEAAISGYVREEQPTYRSMSVGQPMSVTPFEPPKAGFRNMRSAVQSMPQTSIPQTMLPLTKQFDVFQQKDAKDTKASPWTTTTPGAPATVVAPGFSGAPTLPHFLSYGVDHFSCSKDIGNIHYTLASLVALGFDMHLEADDWEYVFESYPGDDHVMIQVRIYQESQAAGFVIDFHRLQGGHQYREELEKIWTFLTNEGLCEKSFKKVNYFSGSLPEFEDADDNFQVEKATIQPELEMIQSPFLDVRRTGAQLLACSFKNKAARNALFECGAISTVISSLGESNDDELDRCLTVALRNASDEFKRDILKHPSGVNCLVSKLEACMNQDVSPKVEVGRNCVRILLALATDDASKTSIRKNNGFNVATTIANDLRNNTHLISLSRTLSTALQPF